MESPSTSPTPPPPDPATPAPPPPALNPVVAPVPSWKWGMLKFGLWSVTALVVMWFVAAYIIVPAAWRRYTARHPALDGMPKITKTGDGIPGDPLNCALIGTEEEITTIMVKAGWQPADPITLKSCIKIASSTVFKSAYNKAPVSNLYLWDPPSKQDLAFQYAMPNPRQRHHVRFWKSKEEDEDGRALWVGAATFDVKVGFSKRTGQFTHNIEKEIDKERDKLFADLKKTGLLAEVTFLDDFHETKTGKNGEGDPWETDGSLVIGLIYLPGNSETVQLASAPWQELFHPALEKLPQITKTANLSKTGNILDGDALNVALIGGKAEIAAIMTKAGWKEIPLSEKAPDLLLIWPPPRPRKQELQFQVALADNQRYLVRFWKSAEEDECARPFWAGSARMDARLANPKSQKAFDLQIDSAQDKFFLDLEKTDMLADVAWIENFHDKRKGVSAGRDPWETAGWLGIGLIQIPDELSQE